MGITDFEKNGRCSGCGQCCCDTMVVTSEEVRRIAQYAQTHDVLAFPPTITNGVLHITCPFRNEVGRRCEIYPVRPLICKTFRCSMGTEGASKNFTRLLARPGATCTHSFHWTFLGDPTICKATGIPLTDRAKSLGCDPSTLRIKEVRK